RVGNGCISYWSYEGLKKAHESHLLSLIGASGCLDPARRSNYSGPPLDLSSVFVIAAERGLLVPPTACAPETICYEDTNRRPLDEIRMRVRVIEQTITALSRYRELLDPRRHGLFAVQLLLHKVVRYLVPRLLIVALLSNLAALNSSPGMNSMLI